MKKVTLTAFAVVLAVSNVLAADGDPAGKIDGLYSSYVRPICVSIVVIMIFVGGVMNLGDVRAGGETAKKAYLSWGSMILFGVIIFASAEIIRLIIK